MQQSCATLCDGNFVIFVQGRASVPVATWPCQHARRLNSYCRASHTGDAVRVGTLARCQETTLFAMLFCTFEAYTFEARSAVNDDGFESPYAPKT